MSNEATDLYHIWSTEHQRWWLPGARGYTTKRSEAGVYSLIHATRICHAANRHYTTNKPFETPFETIVPV